ncbi:MAG: MBL fold metallo-hydrolase RNA specificity domain-containing protein [Bdellovibrionota bacterium]
MIEIECLGAAKTVTGSKHLIRTSRASVLLDCGLFQGHRREADQENRRFTFDGAKLNAIVLSHAHIDHSGALPCIFKNGYRGPIYSTHATRDLCTPMLLDTAAIMKSDADHIQRLIDRGVRGLDPVEPLYGEEEVVAALSQFIGIPYHRPVEIAPGITLTFLDAGHVLGSAISILDIEDEGEKVRLAFTGDLGREHLPIIRPPEIPSGVNFLIMESTYGDRLHEPMELTKEALARVINETIKRGGKIIIPSFALERAQEIIYAMKTLREKKLIPEVPVYVDSPLTGKITDVFKQHPECFAPGARKLLQGSDSPFDFPGLHYISEVEESKHASQSDQPAVVISASGMCEGGRVLHHLIATIENPKNTILIVGFQAEGTLGRRIVEKRMEVRIFGVMRKLEAEVCVLNGFSGHADQAGLLSFAAAVSAQGSLQSILLVHGEPKAQDTLMALLKTQTHCYVEAPMKGQVLRLLRLHGDSQS